jgi:hypothetical protein
MSTSHGELDRPADEHEDPDPGTTWTSFLAGSVIFVAICIGVAALYYDMSGNLLNRVQVEVPVESVELLKAEQQERLSGEARRELRSDTPEGAIVIPIDAAIDLTIEDLAG